MEAVCLMTKITTMVEVMSAVTVSAETENKSNNIFFKIYNQGPRQTWNVAWKIPSDVILTAAFLIIWSETTLNKRTHGFILTAILTGSCKANQLLSTAQDLANVNPVWANTSY